MIGRRVAHYEVESRLGEGGMGEVWVARDVRLGRRVALKRVRTERLDERMRKRLWREARSAAAVSHPGVCQLYDVVEDGDELFLAMELLRGESLAQRLARGALPLHEALAVSRELLRALDAVHTAGLVHRDLKPANLMLTAHGTKILDFGLSRRPPTPGPSGETEITRAGQAVGTPRYMSPEQWAGEDVGPASDIFAAGALLYEMVTGQPAVAGGTLREVMENAVTGRTPALDGSGELARVGRIVARAMERDPASRYASAHAMLEELEDIGAARGALLNAPRRDRYTRLVVLPFRQLRPDPETEFLAASLPEAVVASLLSLPSVVVCGASGATSAPPDVGELARRTSCNAVLSGSILRSGDSVRVTSQLLEAPSGNVLRAHTSQGTLQDIFRLQDDIAHDIVRSLQVEGDSLDRTAFGRQRPADGRAYELYLRANQLASARRSLPEACALYRESLGLDSQWAPAWAGLGRACRVLAKYSQAGSPEEHFAQAQAAFRRALELDPDLPMAHNLYTFLEVEELGRAHDAMVRLLERAKSRGNDPQLFAGLVLACRFCGLLDESVAADRRARHLDPGVRTSVHYTFQLMGDWQRAIEYDDEDMRYVTRVSLLASGRPEDALRATRDPDPASLPGLERHVIEAGRAAFEGRRDDCVAACRALLDSSFHDPEGRFYLVRNLARVGETELAFMVLREVADRGFLPRRMLDVDPWVEPLRAHPWMPARRARLDAGIAAARAAFERAGGPALLSV